MPDSRVGNSAASGSSSTYGRASGTISAPTTIENPERSYGRRAHDWLRSYHDARSRSTGYSRVLPLIVNFSDCDHSRRTPKLFVIPERLLEVHVEILHQSQAHIDLCRHMRGQPDFVVHACLLQHEP